MPPQTPPQPKTADTALTDVQSYQTGMKQPGAILQEREQALGVPQAQQQVSGLRQAITNTTNLLNQIAPSVQGRTATSQVTAAQANRQIANEQAPIQENLASLGQQYGQASGDLNTAMARSQAQAQMEAEGQQNQFGNLRQIYQDVFGGEQAGKQFGLQERQLGENVRQFDVGQSLSERQFAQGQQEFGQQFGEGQRQFNVGQGLAERQFAQGQEEFTKQFGLQEQQFGESQQTNSNLRLI